MFTSTTQKKDTSTRLLIGLISGLALLWGQANSQTFISHNSINLEIKQEAQRLFQRALSDHELQKGKQTLKSGKALDNFFSHRLFRPAEIQNSWYQQKIQSAPRVPGLELTTVVQHNEYNPFFTEQESNSRVRLGLDLDLLREGWIGNKAKEKKLALEQAIHNLGASEESKKSNYSYLYNCLVYNFNQTKQDLLEKRIDFLQSFISIYYQLYFSHELAFEKIITQKSRLNEAKLLFDSGKTFNKTLKGQIGKENIPILEVESMPVLQLDLEALIQEKGLEKNQEDLYHLTKDLLEIKYPGYGLPKLRLYSRYNWGAQGLENAPGSFFSAGASLRMPLTFNHSKEKELANLELALEQENQKEKWYNRTKEIMILFEEYQYKLKQYSNFQHSLFHLEEKLRQEKVLLENPRAAHS
ncbi:MAG: hypothetical protein HKN16_12970, partial [Saprospiraceae bacterium]|nr:hypothetical protein [Saprospiraceae bacterium]